MLTKESGRSNEDFGQKQRRLWAEVGKREVPQIAPGGLVPTRLGDGLLSVRLHSISSRRQHNSSILDIRVQRTTWPNIKSAAQRPGKRLVPWSIPWFVGLRGLWQMKLHLPSRSLPDGNNWIHWNPADDAFRELENDFPRIRGRLAGTKNGLRAFVVWGLLNATGLPWTRARSAGRSDCCLRACTCEHRTVPEYHQRSQTRGWT